RFDHVHLRVYSRSVSQSEPALCLHHRLLVKIRRRLDEGLVLLQAVVDDPLPPDPPQADLAVCPLFDDRVREDLRRRPVPGERLRDRMPAAVASTMPLPPRANLATPLRRPACRRAATGGAHPR